MDKRELESYCGDLAQVFGIEECVLEDGKARGTRGYLLDNGCGLVSRFPNLSLRESISA